MCSFTVHAAPYRSRTTIMRGHEIASDGLYANTTNALRKKNTLIASERLATYATDSVCTGCNRNKAPAKAARHFASQSRLTYPQERTAHDQAGQYRVESVKDNVHRVIGIWVQARDSDGSASS